MQLRQEEKLFDLEELILLFHHLRLKLYASLRLTKAELKKLPDRSGVYYVVRKSEVIYVGKSENFRRRWTATGTAEHGVIDRLRECGELNGCRLYFRYIPGYNLNYIERLEIQRFMPRHNRQFGDPKRYYNWRSKLHDAKLILIWIVFCLVFGFVAGMFLIYG